MKPTHMAVPDLAKRWSCSREVIYRQITAGRLAALHIGQAVRVPIDAVEAYERENTSGVSRSQKASHRA